MPRIKKVNTSKRKLSREKEEMHIRKVADLRKNKPKTSISQSRTPSKMSIYNHNSSKKKKD